MLRTVAKSGNRKSANKYSKKAKEKIWNIWNKWKHLKTTKEWDRWNKEKLFDEMEYEVGKQNVKERIQI